MTKTTNYQLNQWAKSDRIMMDDFNADNQKIDAALKAVADGGAKLAVGTYTGYTNNSGSPFGGVFGVGMPLSGYAEVTANGFTLKAESVNQRNTVYNYIAFK